MFGFVFKKLFGSKNDREVKRIREKVILINQAEESYQNLSDTELKAKTVEFRQRLAQGQTVEDLLPDAFALVKNACRRLVGKSWDVCGYITTWNMIPFDVQLIGGMVLHEGKIAEMATGEGKTLVATMPAYLNALKSTVHIVTVNDYLAMRDSQWMGEVYKFLGLTVGCLQNSMGYVERKKAYACDIVYGTTSEYGFDYLRDNSMAFSVEQQVQRNHFYAIIDEVDCVLIDEARTPLIISGPSLVANDKHKYEQLKPLVEELFQKQSYMCNRLAKEAKELLEQDSGKKSDQREQASIKFFQVRRGNPKNKQLLRFMEETDIRRIIEDVELEMMTDLRKKERFEILEELYFIIDEKGHEIELTEKGRNLIAPDNQDEFIVMDMITAFQEIDENPDLTASEKEKKKDELQKQANEKNERLHNLSQLLRAYALFEKNVEYVIQDDKVMIVDEFTGRIMPGRRYSDGLHQALEAKEGTEIERETQTYATITLQNYFRMYEKCAGMTGTAETESEEFFHIYKLPVIVIPTNKPIRRADQNDIIFKTRREKFNAIVDEVEKLHADKLPVLIGSISVETSELLSKYLKRKNVPHNVLNAKYHQKEAEIIALAGQPGAVTIATNMAGRGTDIKLGAGVVRGEKEGGLQVIGTERHESRRIDRQLRGRGGRQGDPGASRFYISLEDDLMRLFGSDRFSSVMEKMGLKEGEQLTHPLLSKSIETAQKRVEQRNFGIRKHLLEYDDVMNKQRQIIYKFRNDALRADDLKNEIMTSLENYIKHELDVYLSEGQIDEWDLPGLIKHLQTQLLVRFPSSFSDLAIIDKEVLLEKLLKFIDEAYENKKRLEGDERLRNLERHMILLVIDRLWKDHLYAMDSLREGVGLRAYGQRDPLIEYKTEAFDMFQKMMNEMDMDIAKGVFSVSTVPDIFDKLWQTIEKQKLIHEDVAGFGGLLSQGMASPDMPPLDAQSPTKAEDAGHKKQTPYRRQGPKIGPNDDCPCGSGKKYKKCCGRVVV